MNPVWAGYSNKSHGHMTISYFASVLNNLFWNNKFPANTVSAYPSHFTTRQLTEVHGCWSGSRHRLKINTRARQESVKAVTLYMKGRKPDSAHFHSEFGSVNTVARQLYGGSVSGLMSTEANRGKENLNAKWGWGRKHWHSPRFQRKKGLCGR